MEWAFRSPSRLRERMEAAEPGSFSPAGLAALSEDRAVELFSEKPALHRYPKSMGKRAHAVAEMLVDEYDGVASAVWTTAADGSELYRRLRALPGYGEEKAKIFVALLAKRLGIRPDGWREGSPTTRPDQPQTWAAPLSSRWCASGSRRRNRRARPSSSRGQASAQASERAPLASKVSPRSSASAAMADGSASPRPSGPTPSRASSTSAKSRQGVASTRADRLAAVASA